MACARHLSSERARCPRLVPDHAIRSLTRPRCRVRVITYLDMAVVGLGAAGLALGLLHVGRPHLIRRTVEVAGVGLATLRDPRAIAAMLSRRQRAPTMAGTAAGSLSPSSATAAPPMREFVLPHPRWAALPRPDAPEQWSASSGAGRPLRVLGTGSGQPAADDVPAVMAALRPTPQPPAEAVSTPERRISEARHRQALADIERRASPDAGCSARPDIRCQAAVDIGPQEFRNSHDQRAGRRLMARRAARPGSSGRALRRRRQRRRGPTRRVRRKAGAEG